MRTLSACTVLAAALALAACTYVEREVRTPPPAAVVQQPPPTIIQPAPAPPPTVTVRPSY